MATYNDRIIDFNQTVITAALDDECSHDESFCNLVIDGLVDEGECSDYQYAYYKTRGEQVSGYSFDETTGTLELFSTIFNNRTTETNTQRSDITTAYNRMNNFVESCFSGKFEIDPSDSAYEMATTIQEVQGQISAIRMFLLTDGTTTIKNLPDSEIQGIKTIYFLWDVERILNLLHDEDTEVVIDFEEEFGQPIKCLSFNDEAGRYQTLLLLIKGEILGQLYQKWQARIMERNVRAFLQFQGKVNKGIRDTIANEPEMFLAYNNGISAVAQSVEFTKDSDGQIALKSVKGLSIVNGGQTTASVFNAYRENSHQISNISIQAKLVVANTERMDEISPNISKYSNSQNLIQDADFSANDQFHREIERISRNTWAPAPENSTLQTQWFYERARGLHKTTNFAEYRTNSERKRFMDSRPHNQVFTKVQLAQYENTWNI